jgi:hypothetical protein
MYIQNPVKMRWLYLATFLITMWLTNSIAQEGEAFQRIYGLIFVIGLLLGAFLPKGLLIIILGGLVFSSGLFSKFHSSGLDIVIMKVITITILVMEIFYFAVWTLEPGVNKKKN